MADWRNDLMDAILDVRREARSGDGDTSFPEERIDRAVEAARAQAWDEGHRAGWLSRQDYAMDGAHPHDDLISQARNPYVKEN